MRNLDFIDALGPFLKARSMSMFGSFSYSFHSQWPILIMKYRFKGILHRGDQGQVANSPSLTKPTLIDIMEDHGILRLFFFNSILSFVLFDYYCTSKKYAVLGNDELS